MQAKSYTLTQSKHSYPTGIIPFPRLVINLSLVVGFQLAARYCEYICPIVDTMTEVNLLRG